MRLSIGGNENIVKVVSIEEHNKQIRAYERLKVIAEISREMHLLYGNEYEKKIRAEAIDDVEKELLASGFIYTEHALEVWHQIAEKLKEKKTDE